MLALDSRFPTWLLRPYLDLADSNGGPLHAQNLEECWRSFVEPANPTFVPQRALSPGFRIQLAREAGPAYALTDPRQLPENLRSERWRRLCAALDEWTSLREDGKCRLASLLHSMCLYQLLLDLIPYDNFGADRAAPDAVRLAFWRASAHYIQHLPERTSNYPGADISVFEDIALNAPTIVPECFNATAKVFVHKAKNRCEAADLAGWGDRLERALVRTIADADEFTSGLFTSRFYRGLGFLPQLTGDRREVARVMDLAESHARNIKPVTPAQHLLYRENLHAVMESRTKEALWLGDKNEALSRSLKVIEVDPCDSKAWAELGEIHYLREEWKQASEAYSMAAMLGPPASAIGRYMAGLCFRKLGQDMLSAFFLKDTLECDPLGISPRHRINELPKAAALDALKHWNNRP
ncbi:tetratricopeptide repeat protein [Bradyrhizobium sp.]|uniref:tetratricopeptide repeat protein n=1 Tax=Bradyrhizobium sp. TaxID=376 RepID=UPI0040383C93